MFETIAITTFISVWTIERIYFYYYTKTNDDAILNLNTCAIHTPINNNNLNTINSLNLPLANSENAYYYTAPVYNLPNNKNNNENNNKNNNENNNKNNNNTINI